MESIAKLSEIRAQERLRASLIDRGLLHHRLYLRACTVKILILVDGSVSFNQFYFGLSEVLDALRTNPEYWVNFSVTRAHRHSDPNPPAPGTPAADLYAPHHENFRFDQPPAGFDLDDYDQVWFFGFNSSQSTSSPNRNSPPDALTDAELDRLFRWMDEKKGGVFATGDHAQLGASLCARIPRVRGMRKWLDNPAPEVGGTAPPPFSGPTRHDTLVKGRAFFNVSANIQEADRYTFDDESDDLPMKLSLRWYPAWGPSVYPWRWPWKVRRRPHPIFCGRRGIIDVLPDHPHEGEVVVPTKLDDTPQFAGGYQAREYPLLDRRPLEPEIIAWARVQSDHGDHPDDFKGDATPKSFGAVGAYDGHRVSVGRVVTDSTWHHWFDVNLTGRMEPYSDTPGNILSNDLRKLLGFTATPEGQATLARIRNYFTNVAIWLSPPKKIQCMALRAMWGSLLRYPLVEEITGKLHPWPLGLSGLDVIGRRASQCTAWGWWPYIVPELQLDRIAFDPSILERAEVLLFGHVLTVMAEARLERPADDHPGDDELLRLARKGVAGAVDELRKGVTELRKHHEEADARLAKACKRLDPRAAGQHETLTRRS